MEQKVFRCYVEKKNAFDWEAAGIKNDLNGFLGIKVTNVRSFNRYDIQGVSEEGFNYAQSIVFSEPMTDVIYHSELPDIPEGAFILAYEPLPGQFDQRADSCAQCVQMLLGGERPLVRSAKILVLEGLDGENACSAVKKYIINPVECCEASMEMPLTLFRETSVPSEIEFVKGFTKMNADELYKLKNDCSLAMDIDDLTCLQNYFIGEKREVTLTELRVVDTYWSDHCRHTTFLTELTDVRIEDDEIREAYELYLSLKPENSPVTLMGIATAAMKELKRRGKLLLLDESDEVNACTVKVKAAFAKRGEAVRYEDWLLLFKNETHNHPTEIEPFGGAATCIGGAIRDPLSGRAYVYQAMRVTGSADPRRPMNETLPGKLPQRKLTTGALAGYSSYGNQIGLATGLVDELYHPGYMAKRMEIGAVVGAVRADWVIRETPVAGDVVLLLGGRTGRDGIGGATGSSKTHNTKSVSDCQAEVQKGNAPEERKLQRLLRDPELTRMIKRCNDFGAGGVAVAIGELADGLKIDLGKIPKKYEGLSATELAISESQERMAVVSAPENAAEIMRKAYLENIEATIVAEVTEQKRLVMNWNGQIAADLDRAFLNTNGASKRAAAYIPNYKKRKSENADLCLAERLLILVADLNFCSKKGMTECFDNTIGAGSVFMPYGGKYALTPAQCMAALLPVPGTSTASVMSYAFDPYESQANPFIGGKNAVITSLAKLVAAGASLENAYLTLQEYFPRPGDEPYRWGLPLASILGAFSAQMGLEIAAVGGKDSMSGSFNELDVPPTLVSFAVTTENAGRLISPEFKKTDSPVYLFRVPREYSSIRKMWDEIYRLCLEGTILSAWAVETGGVIGGIVKMSFGNGIGFQSDIENEEELFAISSGSIIAETSEHIGGAYLLGYTSPEKELRFGKTFVPLSALQKAWEAPLETVFPTRPSVTVDEMAPIDTRKLRTVNPVHLLSAKPVAVIPTFPGTNGELDMFEALTQAGACAKIILIRNLNPQVLEESALALAEAIRQSHMVVLPGGFSGGDEPDGAGKYIVSLFRHPRVKEETRGLINRHGLMLGVCNGFQALIKLGLVPFGDIVTMNDNCPTLTYNTIGRLISKYVTTRVCSVKSPWLSRCEVGELYNIPIAHGEGRFIADDELLLKMKENGQIAFQYTSDTGDITCNPNGSCWAIEGITSPDGLILGKMGHSERRGRYLAKNIHGNKWQPLFEGGVYYFSK